MVLNLWNDADLIRIGVAFECENRNGLITTNHSPQAFGLVCPIGRYPGQIYQLKEIKIAFDRPNDGLPVSHFDCVHQQWCISFHHCLFALVGDVPALQCGQIIAFCKIIRIARTIYHVLFHHSQWQHTLVYYVWLIGVILILIIHEWRVFMRVAIHSNIFGFLRFERKRETWRRIKKRRSDTNILHGRVLGASVHSQERCVLR